MRLVRYERDGAVGVGVQRPDGSIGPTPFGEMLDAITASSLAVATHEPAVERARVLAPIERPGKILCAGVNYQSHKDENQDAVLPASPFFFSKLPSAVIGPDEPIVIPAPQSKVDYEVELAVVIGTRVKGLAAKDALRAVFGYTVVNDVSGRDVQFVDNQITLGKGFDSFCPMGPAIVTADEIGDPQRLRVSCSVNGELRQSEGTDNMVFTVAELLEALSAHITLEPGDVVTTGTPAGVGLFRRPPTYLAPGDLVEAVVDGIGRLANPVVAGW